ncbi:LicD family protein [Lachnospiraceae bacterium]|nr:LicD family protein [Lachnospiraceae bacterium]
MGVDASFLKEETRCGFLVTEKRKKIWRTELELLEKFDEVCRKYHLTYFAEYGSLLGAVRHQGFIPWDDDIDLMMFRDDYMKLQEIAPSEFTEPYFFQNTYTDLVVWGFSKLRDDRTTGIEFTDMSPDFHQGIFLDIKPFDDAPDGKNFSANILGVQQDVWQTVVNSENMRRYLSGGVQFQVGSDILTDLLNLPVRERFRQFEILNLSHFGTSERVNFIVSEICKRSSSRKREWYSEVIYMPFEHMQIPVPAGYDEILKIHYGNYHNYVPNGSTHENTFFDPDIPYRYYMEHPEKMQDYTI